MENDGVSGRSLFVGKGAVVRATYIRPELPKFDNHPCILALPRINTRKQVLTSMQRFPTYARDPRKLPAHLRSHAAMDLLHFFQPLPIHLRLEGMISRTIRDGYLARNPADPAYRGTLKERLECFKNGRMLNPQYEPTASGFSVAGMSGVGKSTGMKRVLSLYPQVILHSHFKGRNFTVVQIVWLKLECPKDASLTSLCVEFFKVVDDLLGTNYAKSYGGRSRNIQELMLYMAIVAAEHYIGVIVIDEIQDLSTAKSGGATQVLNFFVKLINTIGVPIVIIGTYKAIPIICSEFRLARRGSGQGDLIWDRMSLDEDWQVFVEALGDLQYVRKPCVVSKTLSKTLHDVSYGVTDLAIRIFLAAQVRAIETRRETISEDLIRSAYRDDFRLVGRILETLKSGNIEPLNDLADVLPPAIQPIAPQSENTNKRKVTGIEHERSVASKKSAMQGTKGVSGRDDIGLPKTLKGKRDKSEGTVIFCEDDLRRAVAKGKESEPSVSAYQALLEAGHIRSTSEFSE